MDVQATTEVRFADFRLDRSRGGLFRLDAAGVARPVGIGSRALDVLCVLAARPGELVSRQAIMDAVWPNTVVEDKNLAVQVSALRQALEREGGQGGLIQTVPGRGYRLMAPDDPDPHAPPAPAPRPLPPARRSRWPIVAAMLLAAGLGLGGFGWAAWHAPSGAPPRLSLAVLPFQNLGDDAADEYLADAITDDLTTDLSHIPGALVIARTSARSYKGRTVDARQVGRDLGVRYLLAGSVRRLGTVMRVNAQLVASETGAQLWSDRFDEEMNDAHAGQDASVARLRAALGVHMVEVEGTRGARERPTNPDALDLILRARSLWTDQSYSRARGLEALALYERALRLDPASVPAMLGVADLLLERSLDGDREGDMMERAAGLIAQARARQPNSEAVRNATVFLLRAQERWPELKEAARALIDAYPNSVRGYHHLATAELLTGEAEQAIPLLQTAIRLNPRDPANYHRYNRLALALLLVGREAEAIEWARRSLAAHPEADPDYHYYTNLIIAAAQALSGNGDEARRALVEANRLWPFDTVRSHWPDDLSSSRYLGQVRHLQEGLRLAGERDHADEDADFGVVADARLHREDAGLTAVTVPGATTIRTPALAALLAARKPVIIDTGSHSWGRSLPGAVVLRRAGVGGSVDDGAQQRLRRKLLALTGGDLSAPVVAVGWNSERFDGRNLALRLAALGCTQVYWYRGGREAWEVAGMPETDMTLQDW